ncbi:hypothetical protein Tcan_03519 [Toxocara canis]|uniref:Uncharacterized protein n=1 Tax=Toxocara canis TaxID=6265 RepID=A0A0B2V8I8_TOXCA|nr:hypothetical protein Tcan_03519 [Toxocara canis]
MYHRFVRSASSLFTSQTPLPYVQINEIALPVDGSLPDGMDSIDTRTQLQSSACVASQIEDKQNGGGTRRMQRRVVDVSDHKTCALLMTKIKEANRNQSPHACLIDFYAIAATEKSLWRIQLLGAAVLFISFPKPPLNPQIIRNGDVESTRKQEKFKQSWIQTNRRHDIFIRSCCFANR